MTLLLLEIPLACPHIRHFFDLVCCFYLSFLTKTGYNHQSFATHMDIATSTGTSTVHQGIIASEKPTQIKTSPNETIQVVTILPFRTDGSIYKGVLTYTATKPVEVTFGHTIPIDNTTLSQLDTLELPSLCSANSTLSSLLVQ